MQHRQRHQIQAAGEQDVFVPIFIACANVFDGKGEFHHNAAIKGHNGEEKEGRFNP